MFVPHRTPANRVLLNQLYGMKVKTTVVRPIRQRDGSWKTVMEHIEEEIPDRGRHLIICNKCISETYPDCIAKCGVEKQWRNQKVNIVKS